MAHNLEQLVLDRIMDTHESIQTPEQARDHLDAMLNSEFLVFLSSALEEQLQPVG